MTLDLVTCGARGFTSTQAQTNGCDAAAGSTARHACHHTVRTDGGKAFWCRPQKLDAALDREITDLLRGSRRNQLEQSDALHIRSRIFGVKCSFILPPLHDASSNGLAPARTAAQTLGVRSDRPCCRIKSSGTGRQQALPGFENREEDISRVVRKRSVRVLTDQYHKPSLPGIIDFDHLLKHRQVRRPTPGRRLLFAKGSTTTPAVVGSGNGQPAYRWLRDQARVHEAPEKAVLLDHEA